MSQFYEVTISDDDLKRQYDLRVKASVSGGAPTSYSRQYEAWTPGEGPSVDVESVELQEVVTSIGDYGVSGNLWELDGPTLRHMNDVVERQYADEIERAVLEVHQRELQEAA